MPSFPSSGQKSISESCIFEEKLNELSEIIGEKSFITAFFGGQTKHRNRLFHPYAYFRIVVEEMMRSVNELTIRFFNMAYINSEGTCISFPALYKAISSHDFINAVQSKCDQLIYFNNNLEYTFGADVALTNYLKESLKVSQILAQDGTEIQVRNQCRKTMKASSKGRRKKDGSKAKPTIKLHTTFNDSIALVKHSLTSSAAKGQGEISQFKIEEISNALILADRGYMSVNFFLLLELALNYSIIRGRVNSTCEVLSDNDPNLHKQINLSKQLNHIKPRRQDIYDLQIKMGNSYVCRCIKCARMNGRKKEYALYFTNIPANILSAQQIIDLYRIRWRLCEIPYKCFKSYNDLESINSNKEELIILFKDMSIIAYTLKEIYAKLAMIFLSIYCSDCIKTDIACSHIKVHKYIYGQLKKFLQALDISINDAFVQIEKFSKEFFVKFYMMDKLSSRDVKKLKNIVVLSKHIIEQDSEFKSKVS